jgi:hypothetical protein|tara:strand:+ start:572 stop:1360 length:789 start_codon:yes stop_codon:yes gene_type:complete
VVDFNSNLLDSVVDDYFANSGNTIYMAEVTLDQYVQLADIRRMDPAWLEAESIAQYIATDWRDLDRIKGFYTMHKACVVGSDIYRRGILAPQQMQWSENYKLVAHPGSDRMMYISELITQGLIEDRIHIQIEEQSWMKSTLDVYHWLPDLKLVTIENKEHLKTYYQNWDSSQYYNVPYDTDVSKAGFMGMFKKNMQKYLDTIEYELDSVPEIRHLEIKALRFRIELANTLQKFYDCADAVNLQFGPWHLSHQALVFDPEKAW